MRHTKQAGPPPMVVLTKLTTIPKAAPTKGTQLVRRQYNSLLNLL